MKNVNLDLNERLALYKDALKDYQLALIPLVKYLNNTDYGFCHYFKKTYAIDVYKLPEIIELKDAHNLDNAYWFKQAKIIPRIKFLKDVINITEQKINPDKYLRNEPKIHLRFKRHLVNVYDESKDGPILCTSFEHPNVEYMIRRKHVFDTWTTYSHDTHYKNGLMLFGMIPTPPFNYNELYSKYAKPESNSIDFKTTDKLLVDIIELKTQDLLIRSGFDDAVIQTINE